MITVDSQIEQVRQAAQALESALRGSLDALDKLEQTRSASDEVAFLRAALRVRDLASSYAVEAAQWKRR